MRTDEAFRHACEVRWCVRHFWPNGERMADHLKLIERRRGKPAANQLRKDVRAAWKAEMDSARDERIRSEVRAERRAA